MTPINVHDTRSACYLTNKKLRLTKQTLLMLFIIMLTTFLSACQLTPPEVNNNPVKRASYSQYYLWLKTLDNNQILAEEVKQKSLKADSSQEANSLSQSKLILIYSLSNTSLHQPYKAKRLLNEYLLTNGNNSDENVAFTILLRDQLNSQLHLLEKQNATDKECNKQLDEHHLLIEQLQKQLDQTNKQLNQVNQQLMLLKQIDQNINERG